MDMTRRDWLTAVSAAGVVAAAGSMKSAEAVQIFGTSEQQAEQLAFEKTIPEMQIKDEWLRLRVPGYTMGQTLGVSTNSNKHLFVYSRTNPQGIARGGRAAMLWEFDENYQFIKEWGPNNYAASFAHSVRVDKHDNVWQVDEGSGMIVKYDPAGQSVLWLGRTPEAIDYLETYLERDNAFAARLRSNPPPLHPAGRIGEFNRPTDVTWDSQGNIYVSDGYGNHRVVNISPTGKWLKTVGSWGQGRDQFHTVHAICSDSHDNIYVADRENRRIQVYDTDLNYQRTIEHVAAPWTVFCNPGSPEYLFSGDGTT
jgi:DNA-binding beta-propeller fold protein YncE